MKRFASIISITIIVLTFSVVPISAQITLTYNSYMQSSSVGTIFNAYTTGNQSVSVDIGTASGTAQIWDFSQYSYELISTTESIEPNTSPMHSSFPDANYVTMSDVPGDTIPITYNYSVVSEQGVFQLGVSDESEVMVEYSPYIRQIIFPCTYGSQWVNEPDTMILVEGAMWSITERSFQVDAFGTLILPTGSYSAIRLVQNIKNSVVMDLIDPIVSFSKTITYLTDSDVSAFLMIDESQLDLATVLTNSLSYSAPDNIIGVNENDELNLSGFRLLQNYPNPFNPNCIIGYSIPEQAYVTLKIFDLLGNEMITLVDKRQNPGTYKINFNGRIFPSGIYFYSLQSGKYNDTKKMLLLK